MLERAGHGGVKVVYLCKKNGEVRMVKMIYRTEADRQKVEGKSKNR